MIPSKGLLLSLILSSIILSPAGFSDDEIDNIFFETVIDKEKVYPNEPITLTYYLFTRYDTRYEGFASQPRLRDFWIQAKEIDQNPKKEVVKRGNKKYVQAIVRTIQLFSMKPGKLWIDPGTLKVSIPQKDISKDVGHSEERIEMVLESEPLAVDIQNFHEGDEPASLSYLDLIKKSFQSLSPVPSAEKIVRAISFEPHLDSSVDFSKPAYWIIFDGSGTMLAEDTAAGNRWDLAVHAADRVVKKLSGDSNSGIKVFAKDVLTQLPLGNWTEKRLEKELGNLNLEMAGPDGSSLAHVLFEAALELKDNFPKKNIILISDGTSDLSFIDFLTAADVAKELGVKVHTVAVGKGGLARFPVKDSLLGKGIRYVEADVPIDHETLRWISEETSGKHIVLQDEAQLNEAVESLGNP